MPSVSQNNCLAGRGSDGRTGPGIDRHFDRLAATPDLQRMYRFNLSFCYVKLTAARISLVCARHLCLTLR